MKIKNEKDFWAGAMFVGFGIFFTGFGMRYPRGTASDMGAGYFPVALGILVIVLGAAIAIGGLSPSAKQEKIARFEWRILALILGAVVAFGLLLKPLGLIGSLLVLIFVSSYASWEFSLKATLINSVVLIALCLLIFTWGLDLSFNLWPSFMIMGR